MGINRYWVSWVADSYADEGCTTPPFQFFESGFIDREDETARDDLTICAVLEAESEDAIWSVVRKHFPDYEERFINQVEPDWLPNDRFPNAKPTLLTTKDAE